MNSIYFPPEIGGLESHVYYLCRGLVGRGCDVSIITSRSQKKLPTYEVMDGIKVWRTWLPARTTLGWSIHGVSSIPKLGKTISQADIIHAQTFQSIFPAFVANRKHNAPLISTLHTSHFLERAKNPLWRTIFKQLLRWPDYNLAASVEIADVTKGILPNVKVEALVNGVDTEVFRKTSPTFTRSSRICIVVPRRLFKKNGVDFFIRAMPLIAKHKDVEALIVGDGPERNNLKNLAKKLGIIDRIHFLGIRTHAEMPGILNSAQLAIFPSLMEATSVAVLESMACEIPVAASNVGGLPELIDNKVGGLFEPGNPQALAESVISLLDRDDLPTLGIQARARVIDKWSNLRLVDRHLEVYRDLINSEQSTTNFSPS